MKIPYFRTLLTAAIITVAASSASAQAVPAGTDVRDLAKLGPELKAIIATHRDTTKALLEARKAALELLKKATPAEIEALKTSLRDIMRDHQQDQRELAKAIRDAVKARRDAVRPQ